MPHAFFDNYALKYDEHFSSSLVGKAQRDIVHSYLNSIACLQKSVLEINCGTGVDAKFLSKKFANVCSTDISPEMIRAATAKLTGIQNCCTIQTPIQNLKESITHSSDIVFSNFGGLNCLDRSEMEKFSRDCVGLTTQHPELVFVIMGRKCLWERLYFILKGNLKEAFRRKNPEGLNVAKGIETFRVFYYSPREIEKIFSHQFVVVKTRPVGFLIPPSYLNPFFQNRRILFNLLKRADSLLAHFSALSDYSDHYLIHLKAR